MFVLSKSKKSQFVSPTEYVELFKSVPTMPQAKVINKNKIPTAVKKYVAKVEEAIDCLDNVLKDLHETGDIEELARLTQCYLDFKQELSWKLNSTINYSRDTNAVVASDSKYKKPENMVWFKPLSKKEKK